MTTAFPFPPPAKLLPRAILPMAFFAVLIALAFAQTGHIHAQTPEPTSGEATSTQTISPEPAFKAFSESQAQGIDRMIMCPVCPAETIDQAQVEISRQMRVMVRQMLAEGKERGEILDFFVERYGQDILAAPPKSGINLVVWLLPVAGIMAALVGVFFIIRSMTHREPALSVAHPVQENRLTPYLLLIDRHLEMTLAGDSPFWSGSQPGGASNQPGLAVESPGATVENLDSETSSPEESG